MSNQATRLAEAKQIAERVVRAIEQAYNDTEQSVPRAFCAEASDAAYGAAIDALLALVQPAVSEEAPGWVTVPNTATHNMLNAANAGRKKGRSSSGDIYRAMIEAAPKLSAQSSSKGDEGMQHE